jgi:pyruvate formate lyase activating enzyme
MSNIANLLDSITVEGQLFEKYENGTIRCLACGHKCFIKEGRRGICKVRYNREGKLFVPWGYVAALQVDPIEKKPFNHLLPGSNALTFGMLGCDFHCAYCQNHLSSQALRDPASDMAASLVRRIQPPQLVDLALRSKARIIASSYNEPLITAEWAVDIFKLAVQVGLKCVFISNGNTTPEVLDFLHPYLTAYKIDLKTMQDKRYRQLGGVLENILAGIQLAHNLGLWVDVVTLVVPGFNDRCCPIYCFSLARYPLASYCLPPRLSNDELFSDSYSHAAEGCGDRSGSGLKFCVCWKYTWESGGV